MEDTKLEQEHDRLWQEVFKYIHADRPVPPKLEKRLAELRKKLNLVEEIGAVD